MTKKFRLDFLKYRFDENNLIIINTPFSIFLTNIVNYNTKKYARAYETSVMSKDLNKEIMKKSRLQNNFQENKTETNGNKL